MCLVFLVFRPTKPDFLVAVFDIFDYCKLLFMSNKIQKAGYHTSLMIIFLDVRLLVAITQTGIGFHTLRTLAFLLLR